MYYFSNLSLYKTNYRRHMLQDSNLHRPIGCIQFTAMMAVSGTPETSEYICTKQHAPHNTPIFISQIVDTLSAFITEVADSSETSVNKCQATDATSQKTASQPLSRHNPFPSTFHTVSHHTYAILPLIQSWQSMRGFRAGTSTERAVMEISC
jgi:hypothetical protein